MEPFDSVLRGFGTFGRAPDVGKDVKETFEALIAGLCVMLPEDPWQFVTNNLNFLIESKPMAIDWDVFIDAHLKPKRHLLFRSVMDSLSDRDENSQPSAEMYVKAFSYRRQRLFRFCFVAWLEFHSRAQKKAQKLRALTEVSLDHYKSRNLRVHVREWKVLSASMANRRRQAVVILKSVASDTVLKAVIKSWLECSRVSAQTKKWFKVHEQNAEGSEESSMWYYDEGGDPVSLLPIEVSTKIFIMVGLRDLDLFRCAAVCRSWKEIFDHPLVWNKLDLSAAKPPSRLADDILLKLIARSRPFLGHLNVRGSTFITQRSISAIGQCQNLQDLNLSDCAMLTDKALNDVLAGCSGLLYLNLSYCPITDSSLIVMSRHCTNLRYLSLAYCNQFSSKGLHYIYVRKGCKKINYLDLSGCDQLTSEGMRFIGGAFPVLNTLILDDMPLINDDIVVAFVVQCQTLRKITFRGGSLITDKAVKLLALQSRKLKSIQIENNSLISDVSLKALGKVCRNLEAINVSGCAKITDHGLKALSPLKSLVVVNVADCVRVSDPGVRHIIESPSGANLRELNLTNCYKISDVTLLRLSQRCHKLVYACFSYCEHIFDAGIELMGHMTSLVHLDIRGCSISDEGIATLKKNQQFRHLNLSECAEMTDNGIEKMVENLSCLESLEISECEHITDSSVRQAAFHCHLLTRVNLSGCQQITDASAKYLAQGCGQLSWLDMSQCNVSDTTLKHLRKSARNIKQLNIMGCPKITRDAVKRFQAHCPEIHYSQDPYSSQPSFDYTLPLVPSHV